MAEHSPAKNSPKGAPVVGVKSDTPGQQDYRASAMVDGQELTLLISENVAGVKDSKTVSLLIGAEGGKKPLQYSAVTVPSSPKDKGVAFTRILTPHKDVTAQPDLYAYDAAQYPKDRAAHERTTISQLSKIEQMTSRDYELFVQNEGMKLNDMARELPQRKADVEFTKIAPAIVHFVDDAMFAGGSPCTVTQAEFRKIRDVFQQIDATPQQATNASLPQMVDPKAAPKR